jgi:eukaryotic-like serine/threonine-protein kinase
MAEDPLTTHARGRVGRTLRGKWTLDRLVGVGGMAAVYEATHRNGSKVAIKMLHPTLMFDSNFAQRLIQEGYVANKINHPAAVKIHDDDTDETDGTVFLVMEFLDGVTLSQARRKRKKFPALEVFKLMDPVLECLASAHEKSIIHRDIKPENLFLTKNNVVRVLDFGIARINDGSNMNATRTGMVVGSPAYMSPEQALGKMNSVGPQTDVYAVGATMFALMSGTTPHAGESTQEMIVMVATQAARPIIAVLPDAPPPISRVIDKALAYNREDRYPDAGAMLIDLRAAVAELEGGVRVLPTFADDEEGEGATTVSSAVSADKPSAAPLPAAGMNRVGIRPPTGKFSIAPPTAPVVPTTDPPPVPKVMSGAVAVPPPPRARAATLAPIGTPSLTPGSVSAKMPLPPPPGSSSGLHVPVGTGTASGNRPFGAFDSGQHQAPFGDLSDQSALRKDVPAGNFPPTMAIAAMNPADLGAPGGTSGPGFTPPTGTSTGPGNSSGQRPGATTNMAWAAPPEGLSEEPAPPPQRRTPMIIAAALAGVMVLGGIGFAVSGSGSSTPPTTNTVRPVRPVPAHVTTPAVVAPAVVAPAVVAPAVVAPAVVAPAVVAPVVAENPPVAPEVVVAPRESTHSSHSTRQGDPAPTDDNTHTTRRHRVRDTGTAAAPPATPTPRVRTPRPPRNTRSRDPLGY